MSLTMFLALSLGLSTDPGYKICACECSKFTMLRLDAVVSNRSIFYFSLLNTRKNLQRWQWTRRSHGAKKCHPIFWGYSWIISNALLQWCKSAAPARNSMNVFRKAKHSWFQVQWIKCLKTEAWICLSISLPWLKMKGWLEYLWINYEWIFLLAYAISLTTSITAL